MTRPLRLLVLSDVHYASEAERARGAGYEFKEVASVWVRGLLRAYRHFVWLRDPLSQNGLLDQFLESARDPDCVVANGDYSCDSAFVGVSDDAAFESARECLGKLRQRFGSRFEAVLGDHELGKINLAGSQGGMRLASYSRARDELGLRPFWQLEHGCYVLIGVTSSLVALPVFEADALAAELAEWRRLREQHLCEIRHAFSRLKSHQRVLLFCHDPSALPMLANEESVRRRLPQIERTVIGHLHSNLILWKSRILAGIPPLGFMGHSVKRMSTALSEARQWKPFRLILCPALAGIELLKDGGYLSADLDPGGSSPARFSVHRIAR